MHRVICEKTGLLATEACPKIRREVFIAGTEPRACDRHGSSSARTLQDLEGVGDIDERLLHQN